MFYRLPMAVGQQVKFGAERWLTPGMVIAAMPQPRHGRRYFRHTKPGRPSLLMAVIPLEENRAREAKPQPRCAHL
jgi:hypothetical protein